MIKFLKQIGQWIKRQFDNSYDFIDQNAHIAINIVNTIKQIMDNPLVNIITTLTPTPKDDLILKLAKTYLSLISREMLEVRNILQGNETPEQVIEKLIEYIKTLNVNNRSMFYVELSARITQVLSDGKITLSEAIMITQFIYGNRN